ncbi:Copper-transporting ATPase 2 [Trichoplax sp. H2]|nr:Copper-transporting ATPase 2 [Trichoplax sp. H2]|eukprot:RDD46822.1 Copper-transporting ATPase 2 [Trichoplax sp. H2]
MEIENNITQKILVTITGMTCNSCVKSIQSNVATMKGLESIKVSLSQEEGEIAYFPHLIDYRAIINEIEDMGFDAKLKSNRIDLQLKLQPFSFDRNQLTQNLMEIHGVENCSINDELNALIIRYNCDLLQSHRILIDCFNKLMTMKSNDNHDNSPKQASLAVVSVIGMTCNSCVKSIEGTLSDMNAIKFIGVSLEKKQATVRYDSKEMTERDIVENIEDMGFDATILQTETNNVTYTVMEIEGMSCNSCVQHIESTVLDLPGIYYIRVSLQQRKADIFYAHGHVTVEQISEVITDAGFDVKIKSDENNISGNSSDSSLSANGSDNEPKKVATVEVSTTSVILGENEALHYISKSHQFNQRKHQSNAGKSINIDNTLAAAMKSVQLSITGMSCSSCVANIEREIKKKKGIISIAVALLAERGEVTYDANVTNPEAIVNDITELGFGAIIISSGNNSNRIELSIDNIVSPSCVDNVESYFRDRPGIISASVFLSSANGVFEYDASVTGVRDIIRALNVGFIQKFFELYLLFVAS